MQLENVGSVGLQFSWEINMHNITAGVAPVTRTPRGGAVVVHSPRSATVDSPRPASAGPLMIRVDDTSNIRPSSALACNIISHLSVALVSHYHRHHYFMRPHQM